MYENNNIQQQFNYNNSTAASSPNFVPPSSSILRSKLNVHNELNANEFYTDQDDITVDSSSRKKQNAYNNGSVSMSMHISVHNRVILMLYSNNKQIKIIF